MRLRIYVSGPISKPDGAQDSNVERAIAAADHLLEAGFAPYVPHLTLFWHAFYPHDWQTWLELDLPWVAVSDAVLRLQGESKGADVEVEYAEALDIPVFHSREALFEWAEMKEATLEGS